jgi:hypothetical protein
MMRQQTIQYTSPLDALVAVAKRLSLYENQYQMDSEEFFNQYSQGQLSDDAALIEWQMTIATIYISIKYKLT